MPKFYDTCTLLNSYKSIFGEGEPFYYSSITLTELENIKTSASKDEDIKYSARQLGKLLQRYHNRISIPILYSKKIEEILTEWDIVPNNDAKIVATAKWLTKQPDTKDLIFCSSDTLCRLIAHTLGVPIEVLKQKEDDYTGYKEIVMDEDDLILFYSCALQTNKNSYGLLTNEYLIIKDTEGNIVDYYRWTGEEYEEVKSKIYNFDSAYLGSIKPYNGDPYQKIAMNMLENNQISVLRGPAGSGKSYLALGYLFSLWDRKKIDKIIIFCNTVATKGSAKLGYYPGSRTEKLLDSQIGNFLESKIGDRCYVEKLINDGVLTLLPMSDIRGYDTSGQKAAIYITEAQNLDIELMKLALQRIGDDSICVLDGDDTAQVDMTMYAGDNNGLREVSKVFRGCDFYGEVTLQKIFRSKIAERAQLMGNK